MKGKWINPTGQWFGSFAKFGVNPAQSFFIEENASSIGRMRQPVAFAPGRSRMPFHHRLVHSIFRPPVLGQNSLAFDFGDLNKMLTTAATTIVAAPVLQNR